MQTQDFIRIVRELKSQLSIDPLIEFIEGVILASGAIKVEPLKKKQFLDNLLNGTRRIEFLALSNPENRKLINALGLNIAFRNENIVELVSAVYCT